jgi:hypothetical protein
MYVLLIITNINYVIVRVTWYCINMVFLQVTTNTEGRKKSNSGLGIIVELSKLLWRHVRKKYSEF